MRGAPNSIWGADRASTAGISVKTGQQCTTLPSDMWK
jgi:hypothetical protein